MMGGGWVADVNAVMVGSILRLGERGRVVTCDFNFDRVKTAGKTHRVMQPSFFTVVQ